MAKLPEGVEVTGFTKTGYKVDVNITKTDTFKELVALLGEILGDKEIPEIVRFKYFTKLERLKGEKDAYKNGISKE